MSEEQAKYHTKHEAQAPVKIHAELTQKEAWAFAEYLKRIGLSEFRLLAANEAEAYEMQTAGETIRMALADAGIDPR